ncbi:MAG TPA: type II toxin-antitoxin system PemK/MazF family toxin, partial [Acidimicrobiia bacterium]|nr:type II toxin-antitoxin system PemK/MazF family toxin [Acidimicrobiia bacterium]
PLLRIPVVADESNGLGQDSYIMVDKLTTVRRTNTREVVGQIDHERLVEIERRLMVFIGLAG